MLIGHSFVYVGVAALSMALAVFGGNYASAYSGMAYGMIGPCQGLYHGLAERYWKPPVPAAAIRACRRRAAGAQLRKPGKRVALIA